MPATACAYIAQYHTALSQGSAAVRPPRKGIVVPSGGRVGKLQPKNKFSSSALQSLRASDLKKNNSNLGNISVAQFAVRELHSTTGSIPLEQEQLAGGKSIITNRLTEFLIDNELNPVFSYEDLQLDEVRKKISFETRNLSGVYMVLNKVTLDFYIGSASTGKIYSRFYRHLISFNGSKIVKYAVKKYKLTSFAFLVLELFPEIVTKENNNKLIALEDLYLKTMLPNYNILTEAGSSFGYKHTEITRLNMSKNYSQARKDRIKNLNKGKTLSPETIEKIREKALERENPRIFTDEALANMKKKSKPIILYNLDRTVYGEFPSISEAAKAVGCGIKTINRALKTEKKLLKKRFIVKLAPLTPAA
jgi:group I intron endonuclease